MIIYLEISSWSGVSIGAEHYYGTLICTKPWSKIELETLLTSRQAKNLNKKDGLRGFYKVGRRITRFDSSDEIIDVAIKEYKKHFPNATFLLLGSPSSHCPKFILDGDEKIKILGNELFDKYDKLEWVNKYGMFRLSPKDEEISDKLSDKFYELFS